MRLLIVLYALLAAVAAHATLPNAELEEFVAAEMEASGTPGLSYGTLIDGQIATGVRGVESLSSNEPVTVRSAFLIGSVSKNFTALATMQLIEAGKLELDAPISAYLSSFEAGTPAGDATIRQLMSHTSGYSMFQGNMWQDEYSMAPDALERRVEEIAAIKPETLPGKRWDYSNINYMLLARLIEVASGQRFADYMEQNVFIPAGMTNTYINTGADDSRMVSGHTPWFTGKRVLQGNQTGLATAGPGGVVSTASDLLRYLELMMNGEDDLLSAAGKAQMMQPANEISPDYGFGWFLNTEEGIVSHSGSNPGFEALATMVPAERKAGVILGNSGSGFALNNGWRLQYGFIDRALGINEDPNLPGSGAIWIFAYALLSPFVFALALVFAWYKRESLRAKSGLAGKFSLWFPLLAVAGQAFVLLVLVPRMFGAPLSAIGMFQPDMHLLIVVTAVTGIIWAIVRLAIAYTGKKAAS